MNPKFSHQVGKILESPYWLDVPEDDFDAIDRRFAEKEFLRDEALEGTAESYDDLSDEAKRLWDAAQAAEDLATEREMESYARFLGP